MVASRSNETCGSSVNHSLIVGGGRTSGSNAGSSSYFQHLTHPKHNIAHTKELRLHLSKVRGGTQFRNPNRVSITTIRLGGIIHSYETEPRSAESELVAME